MRVSVFVLTCFIGCLATSNIWEVIVTQKVSDKSRFYVLHDWKEGDGVYSDGYAGILPASQVSDVMLSTMGILRDGLEWDGVRHGNLFKRPRATALFVVDGIADQIDFGPLSDSSYPVDQSSLPGHVSEDIEVMFSGDNVMKHFHDLFNGQPVTQLVSGDSELSSLLTPERNLASIEKPSDEELTQIVNSNAFDGNSQIVSNFITELLTIQSFVKKLSQSAVTDKVPDVYVFCFTAFKAMQDVYGADSNEIRTALRMIQDTIKQVTDELVKVYDGDIVVQALVLQWKYRALTDQQKDGIKLVLKDHDLTSEEIDSVMKGLPRFELPNLKIYIVTEVRFSQKQSHMDEFTQSSLCDSLAYYLDAEDIHFHADCTQGRSMLKRDAEATYFENSSNSTDPLKFGAPKGIVDQRSENFPAIFLIVFVTVVPMALALFAISWAMWNMDPGRDSVIYRNTDNIPGINLQ